MSTTSATTGRLHLLDGMRGLAAFAVIVDHVPSETLEAILPGRYLAVDFFFVLSGLVLARAYGDSLAEPGGISRFLKLRLIRLYPLYLLGFAVGCALTLLFTMRGWNDFELAMFPVSVAGGLIFLPTPATLGTPADVLFPFDPPAWTLLFELIANFAWAFTAFLFRGRMRYAILITFAVWAALAVYYAPALGAGWAWSHINAGLARVFFSFFAGVALYQALNKVRLPRIPSLVPVVLLAFILMCPAGKLPRSAFDVAAMLMIIPATVFIAAHSEVPKHVARVCDWLGSVSYGVYVLHFPLFLAISLFADRLGLPPSLQVFAVAAASAIAAHISGLVYERPIQRRLRTMVSARKD